MTATRKTSRPKADALVLAERVRAVVGDFVRHVRTATSTLRSAQLETLELLDRVDSMTVAELARRRGVKHQSMRLVVAELEAEHWVTRQPNPDDARGYSVRISATARVALATAREQRARWIAEQIDRKLDAEHQRALSDGLAALRQLID